MAVWYLDNDDEITDAVARLRGTTDSRVVFVVPAGSRIATGRINFKLLAREAESRDLSMAVASPDAQVRALALAAGVLGLSTVDEAEAALERGDVAPQPATSGAGVAPAVDAAAADAAALAGATAASNGRKRWASIAVFVVLALVVLGGVLSLENFTTAEITLQPRRAVVGPIEMTISALTSTETSDPDNGTIPAVEIPIPLTVTGSFASSGSETIATRATGEVLFSAEDQSFDQDIVAGTRVRTPAGVEFQTTGAVVLARPVDSSGPAQVRAAIEAIEAGPDGDVAAGTITVVPSLASQGISVVNPEATEGGELQTTPIVTRQDYDAATVDLQNRLAGELAARLRDPGAVPEGLTLFPETASLGSLRHEPTPADVVGQPASDFELSASATARAVGVDERLVEAVMSALLLDKVPPGLSILPSSVAIQTDDGVVAGRRVDFESTASGDALVLIDVDALTKQVAGLPVSEARAILEELGTTTVTVSPDFLGALPNDPDRIRLAVQEPTRTE